MKLELRMSVVALITLALVSTGWPALATICVKTDGACTSKTSLIIAVNPPPTLCLINTPIIQIDSKAFCLGAGPAGPARFFRCAVVSTTITYSGSGMIHKLAPNAENNWGTVEAGNCAGLDYSAS